ncbi:bifunctional riboflavin kinase/FAD synthetase [Corynebacterium sp. 13CS0277]|uniref:bifunctional riboflavin kinase/FAD synthetase n=1 Tax=Corynebacterium sp. 13CS0277 TaxID=2071994 RepID=UPI000D02AF2D|nr:bifunctional riboflavin kinase/FAD synthetase [Corynebacterium sp. 13CS0277]PRQ12624.1 bifunctional riboflavin kinase/FAD synthetase [Corynebacterium sp. 13CS0277]
MPLTLGGKVSAVEIWHSLQDLEDSQRRDPAGGPLVGGSVVTIGMFDGIHRGHQKLIRTAIARARELGLPAVMVTFEPHPLSVVRPEAVPPMLSTFAERAERAAALGIDAVVAMRFDAELAAMSPEEFAQAILVDVLHARAVAVGENFTFGHKAAGTTATLRELGEVYGFEVDVVELLAEDGTVLSSSVTRGHLRAGDVGHAAHILGRPFSVRGCVCRGAGRGGRELGYPTANLYFPEAVAIPADGVYCGWFTVEGGEPTGDMIPGVRYPTAVSVGTNPTFGDERRSVEAFVLDREADLYDREVTVEFVARLRGMEKFTGVDDLLQAMARDVARSREILGTPAPHPVAHADNAPGE